MTPEALIIAIAYLALAGAYLLVIPFGIFFYLQARWYVASSFERGFMYFLVFFFFPGLLLLAPILNFRPRRRVIEG
jgi:NAD(P)H-quinone oxidoreductase subunit L